MIVKIKTANIPNKNGIIYPLEILQNICISSPDEILGTIGLPEQNAAICLISASHVISNLRIENDILVGDLKLLNTTNGKKLEYILLSGNCGEFRPTGYGVVGQNGVIQKYELFSIDFLSDPA